MKERVKNLPTKPCTFARFSDAPSNSLEITNFSGYDWAATQADTMYCARFTATSDTTYFTVHDASGVVRNAVVMQYFNLTNLAAVVNCYDTINATQAGYAYRYNGQKTSPEIGSGHQTALYWEYDARTGRRWNLDPVRQYFVSQYATFGGNPVRKTDVLGDYAGEFEVTHDANGKETKKKISDLGDKEGIDFNHHLDGENAGKTDIVNRENGRTFQINSSILRGFKRSGASTNWLSIFAEWEFGYGPENRLMYGADHPMNKDISRSKPYQTLRQNYLEEFNTDQFWSKVFENEPRNKGRKDLIFGPMQLQNSGPNMTLQMMGSYKAYFYNLTNNKMLVIATDQKTKQSFYYHLPWIRNASRENAFLGGEGDTHQTYMWIENINSFPSRNENATIIKAR